MNKIAKTLLVGAAAFSMTALGSCHIYQKYETPTSTELTRAYAEAKETPSDSTRPRCTRARPTPRPSARRSSAA